MYAVTKMDAKSAPGKETMLNALDRGLARHPVLMLTSAIVLMGTGMVLAVAVGTVICTLPIALLMGWI